MDLFSSPIEHLGKISNQLDKLVEVAVDQGLNPNNINLPNMTAFIKHEFKELNQYKAAAAAAGYTSVGVALKSLRQYKGISDNIPPDMMYAPDHWVFESYREEVDGKEYKVPGVNAVAAQARRKQLHHLLDDFFYSVNESSWPPLDKEGMIQTCRFFYFKRDFETFAAWLLQNMVNFSDRENGDWAPNLTQEEVDNIWKTDEINAEHRRKREEERRYSALRERLKDDVWLDINQSIEMGLISREEAMASDPAAVNPLPSLCPAPPLALPFADPWASSGDITLTGPISGPQWHQLSLGD